MRYYKLFYTYNEGEDRNYIFCNPSDLKGMDQYSVLKGKSVKDAWTTPDFFFDPQKGDVFSDNLCNVDGWLIVSKQFVEKTCEYLRDYVEFLDVNIINIKTNEIYNDYKVLNIVKMIDALDLKHSDYFDIGETDNPLYIISKHAFYENKVEGYDIFKDVKDFTSPFISEKIKKIIDENEMTGFAFLEARIY